MTTLVDRAPEHIRREADRLEGQRTAAGGFTRRGAPEATPGGEALVRRAVAHAKQGDPDAIRLLYVRHVDSVFGYVSSIVRNHHEAEDVTQQVFSKVLTALAGYEPRLVPFSSWVLRIAHNAALDHVRARRSVPVAEVHEPGTPADESGSGRGEELREALLALPAEQREVVVLRLLCGYSTDEVADRIGRSNMGVCGLQHRARRALRSDLTRRHSGPATMARA